MPAFDDLIPDLILDAVEKQGLKTSGSLIPLNSYENRVYQIGLEDGSFVVTKFYRPGRWNLKQLAEEHHFVNKLAKSELPVVPANKLLRHENGYEYISCVGNYYYSIWPRFRGRLKDDLNTGDREILGRLLSRLHLIGEKEMSSRPPILSCEILDQKSQEITEHEVVPDDLRPILGSLIDQLLDFIFPLFSRSWKRVTLHGDCHHGNVLWNEQGAFLVDFDDLSLGPAVQDIWMLFYGDKNEQAAQREEFFNGYETFREFDWQELQLCEALRARRMILHAHWLSERWQETVFKQAFPYFSTRKYWEELSQNLREQIALLQDIESPF